MSHGDGHDPWMSFTDLMSGFLVVFMLATIVAMFGYMEKVREIEEESRHVIETQRQRDSLQALIDVYKDSLDRKVHLRNLILEYAPLFAGYDGEVKVVIDKAEGSIKLCHRNPEKDLFKKGESAMNGCLRHFLDEFGRQMIDKTIELKSQNSDIEFRIEGHTDPAWKSGYRAGEDGVDYSYIKNLELSSARANSVYTYVLDTLGLDMEQKRFLQKHMISVGYSFSDRIKEGTVECASLQDQQRLDAESRRVEFRIIAQ